MRARRPVLAAIAAFAVGLAAAGGELPVVRICDALEEAAPPGAGPVLLVFFSTECSACYGDLFEMRYLLERKGWPVAVVGVTSGVRDDLRMFLEKYAWTLPVVLDRRKALFRKFKVDTVPFKALLVGTETLYRDDPYGAPDKRRKDLEQCLEKLFSR
jgi:hypothetical protein